MIAALEEFSSWGAHRQLGTGPKNPEVQKSGGSWCPQSWRHRDRSLAVEDSRLMHRGRNSPCAVRTVVYRNVAEGRSMGLERRYTKGWWGRRREGKGGWTGGRLMEVRAAVDWWAVD